MAIFTAGSIDAMSFDGIDILSFVLGDVVVANATTFSTSGGGIVDTFTGSFQYSGNQLVGGVITGLGETYLGATVFTLTGVAPVSVQTFIGWVNSNANTTAISTIFAGDDVITGSPLGDQMRGYGGADRLLGGGGGDSLAGEAGQDFIRGEEGNDLLTGGAEFDDMHGNQGNDTLYGGDGDDWVVGGQSNDLLHGEAGLDIVHGSMGADSLYGGGDRDVVRGGQDGDSLSGEAGDDWMSGDRGSDTISGGAGADTFHFFAGAGLDRVVDFSIAQGDRVMFETPGASYTVAQVGADTVITIAGVDQMVLVGVDKAALPAGWLING
jgi:serralysin